MNIDRVKIKNFKSLKDIDISLSNLTLITGVNSSGKSSFIQALLLIKQNQSKFNNLSRPEQLLSINGAYVQLGNKKDILYQELSRENIKIELIYKDNINYLEFNNNDLIINNDFPLIGLEESYNIFNNDFQYIQTDRIAPKISYGLSDENIQDNLIGINGEYTAQYLTVNRHKRINIEALIHRNAKTSQLLENVSLWLNEISENIEVKADVQQNTLSATLSYMYTYGDNTTNEYTPLNIGFGITYVLPIIVSILKAKEGDLVIIENPESHLHPAGQSKVAELCAIASANEVQIIIETHSDHFLNAIRIATKKVILIPEQSKVYYFRKEKDKLETIVDEINIDENGSIDKYPKRFFDQFDDDLDELLGL